VISIICNSGPLIALGVLGRLDLLKSLFDVVMVPEAVAQEIEQGGIKLAGLADFRRADWIRILSLKEKPDELLESLLDVGEADADDAVMIGQQTGRNHQIAKSKIQGKSKLQASNF
jgi:predicted nucleic acid-binding protein